MELRFLLRALYKRKFWLISVMTAAVGAAYLLAARYEKLYQSVTKIATGFTVANRLESNESIGGFYETDIKFNNLIENITSSIVVNQLAYRLIIHDLSEEKPFRQPQDKQGELLLDVRQKAKYLALFRKKLQNMEMLDLNQEQDKELLGLLKAYGYSEKLLRETFYVVRNGFSDYITIAATTDHPQLSAFIVNTLFEEFARYNNSVNTVQTSETVERLDSLLKAKQLAKERALEAYKEYQRTANVLDVDIEGDAALKQISNLEERITDEEAKIRRAQLALAEVEAKIAKLEEEKKNSNSSALSGSSLSVRKLNQTLLALEQRRKRSPNNEVILDSIILINAELNRMGATVGGFNMATRLEDLYDLRSENRTQIATSTQTLENLRARLKAVADNKSSFAQKGARIKLLQENLDLASKEYEEVLQRYNKVLENKNMMSGIKQVIVGQPAQESQRFKRIIITLAAGGGALILAIMVIVLVEFLDDSPRTPTIFSRQTQMPLLAVLPQMKKADIDLWQPQRGIQPSIGSPDTSACNQALAMEQDTYPLVVAAAGLHLPWAEKKSEAAQAVHIFKENIRLLRHEIETSGKKVILFTSLRKSDGKTLIIRSLAQALNKAGKRVLLIDFNFANHTLTELYAPQERIEDLLQTGNYRVADLFFDDNSAPQVIGCRLSDSSPAELIQTSALQRFIAYQSQLYDYILMECADMEQHSDAMELAIAVEGVVCVGAAYHTLNQTDRANIERLKKRSGALIGSVLNRVDTDILSL